MITIVFATDDPRIFNMTCECGYNKKNITIPSWRKKSKTCEKCNNENLKYRSVLNKKVSCGAEFFCPEKTDKSFVLVKYSTTAVFDDVEKLRFKLEKKLVSKLKMDMTTSAPVFMDAKDKIKEDMKLSSFFGKISKDRLEEIIDTISTEKNKPYWKYFFQRDWGNFSNEYKNNKLSLMEQLISIGYKNPQSVLSCIINSEDKQLHNKLGIPKFLLSFVLKNQNLSGTEISNLRRLSQIIDGNNFRIMCEIFDQEGLLPTLASSQYRLDSLIRHYGYKDMKRLSLYLTREVKVQQGITKIDLALDLLTDYAKMSDSIGLDYDKYPKSLKKSHDVTSLNYKVAIDAKKNAIFTEAVESEDYSFLEYQNKNYSIIRPKLPKDVVREGTELNHCVASYVDDVIFGRCKILFMRNVENIDDSLVTIEVRGNVVRQVRGKSNRNPTEEEYQFVKEWSKEKELKHERF